MKQNGTVNMRGRIAWAITEIDNGFLVEVWDTDEYFMQVATNRMYAENLADAKWRLTGIMGEVLHGQLFDKS